MGLVSLTFRTNMSLVEAKPLQMALVVAAWQGLENVDRVTEWPPGEKVNSIVSPAAAVMVSGVKTSPFLPTATWWMFDAEAAAAALVAVVVEDDPAGLPYCASVLHSMELRKSRENGDGDMVDDGGCPLCDLDGRRREGFPDVTEAVKMIEVAQ
jgi:hypothetical protein